MSFVSVVVNKYYCTIMSDGRVAALENENGQIVVQQEDYCKIKCNKNNTSFVTFTGAKWLGEYIFNNIDISSNWYDESIKSLQRLMQDSKLQLLIKEHKPITTRVIFGGLNSYNKIEVYIWDSANRKAGKVSIPNVILSGDDQLFDATYKLYQSELTTREHKTPEDYIETQKLLNNFVAENSHYVNKNIYHLIIRRP